MMVRVIVIVVLKVTVVKPCCPNLGTLPITHYTARWEKELPPWVRNIAPDYCA